MAERQTTRLRRGDAGFSLIKLLLVIVILGGSSPAGLPRARFVPIPDGSWYPELDGRLYRWS